MRKTQQATAGFGDESGLEPKNTSVLWNLEKAKNQILP